MAVTSSNREEERAVRMLRSGSLSPHPPRFDGFRFDPSIKEKIEVWFNDTRAKFMHLKNPLFVAPSKSRRSQGRESNQWAFFTTVLEHSCVDLCVSITPLLAHFNENIRGEVALALTNLAQIFDPEKDYYRKTRVIVERLKESQEVYSPIHELFIQIGHALGPIAYPYVVGLEGLYLHPETNCRDCAITVVSRMVVDEHLADSDNEQSNLTIVCNLIFLLDDIDHTLHGHRLAPISALGLLAEFYSHLQAITSHVVHRMLTLKDKSPAEREETQKTLSIIFSLVAASDNKFHLLSTFGSILTATDEENYDILVETLEEYLQAASPVLEDRMVQQYVLCVQEHLSTAQPMVRYGAVCSFYILLKALGNKLLRAEPSLVASIISGCMDSNCSLMAVNLEVLAEISRLSGLKRLNDTIELFLGACTEASSESNARPLKSPPNLAKVLELAIQATNASIEPGTLINMANANSLRLLKPKERLNQLQLVNLWARTVKFIDSVFLQQLLSLLECPEDEIVEVVLDIFVVLRPALQNLDIYDTESTYLYFMKLLQSKQANRSIFDRILNTMVALPFDKLETKYLEDLPHFLLKTGGVQRVGARISLYQFLSAASHYWKTVDLSIRVLSLLVLAMGDESSKGAAEACKSVMQLCNHLLQMDEEGFEYQPAIDSFLETLIENEQYLGSKDIFKRLNSFDKIASCLGQKGIVGMNLLATNLLSERSLTMAKAWFETEHKGKGQENSVPYFPHWLILLFGRNIPRDIPNLLWKESVEIFVEGQHGLKSNDNLVRDALCDSLYRCCFLNSMVIFDNVNQVINLVMKGLTDPIHHKRILQGGVQILARLVPLNIHGLGKYIVHNILGDLVQKIKADANWETRGACLRLTKAIILSYPGALTKSIKDIQKIIRTLFAHPRPEIRRKAADLYPMLFHFTKDALEINGKDEKDLLLVKEIAVERFQWLSRDVMATVEDRAVDNLLAKMSPRLYTTLLIASIEGMGELRHPMVAKLAAEALIDKLTSSDRDIRGAAMRALINLSRNLPEKDAIPVRWAVAPLFADNDSFVRAQFQKLKSPKELSRVDCMFAHLNKRSEDGEKVELFNQICLGGGTMSGSAIIPPSQQSYKEIVGSVISQQVEEVDLQIIDDMDGYPPHDPSMIQNIVVNKALMTAAQELVSNFCQNCDTATIADIEVYMQKYIRADMFANIASLFLAASLVCLVGKRKPHSKSLEKAKSIVRSMLLRASVDANAQNEDLINSVAVGLEHATLFKTDLVLPMLAEQVAKSIHIKSGELVVLRYVFKPFASDHSVLAKLVPRKIAQKLIMKFKDVLQNPKFDASTKKVALDLLGELSAIAGEENIPTIINAITGLLESTTDEEVHEKCQDQLKVTFASKGKDNPMVQSVVKLVEAAIGSPKWEDRQRAVVLFSSYISETTNSDAIKKSCRFLADPEPVIREQIIKTLILNTRGLLHEKVIETLTGLFKEDAAMKEKSEEASKKAEMRRLKSGLQVSDSAEVKTIGTKKVSAIQGSKSEEVADKAKPRQNIIRRDGYTIPLFIEDPLNKTFLASEEYARLRRWYGMTMLKVIYSDSELEEDAETENVLDALAKQKKIETIETEAIPKKASTSVAVVEESIANSATIQQKQAEKKQIRKEKKRATQIAEKARAINLTPVIRALIAVDAEKGNSLLRLVGHNITLLENFLESHDAEAVKPLPSQDEDLIALNHLLMVDMVILQGHVRLELRDVVDRIQNAIKKTFNHCEQIREVVARDIELQSFAEWDVRHVPIEDEKTWLMFQHVREEAKKSENGDIKAREKFQTDYDSRELRMQKNNIVLYHLTHFLGGLIQRFAPVYADPYIPLKSEDSFGGLLWIEESITTISHRGVRYAFREALTHASETGAEVIGRKNLCTLVNKIAKRILEKQEPPLRRRMVDIAFLLGCLMPQLEDTKTKQTLVTSLIKLWEHPDSEVARESMNAILRLGKLEFPEVMDIAIGRRGLEAKLMREVRRVKGGFGSYFDKHVAKALSELEQWCQFINISKLSTRRQVV